MSMINGSLELSGGTSGTKKLYNSPQASIPGNYSRARVLPSQPSQPPSMWVIYKFENWDHSCPEDRPEIPAIVEVGGEGVDLKTEIRSVQGFNRMNPGIILFEHSQYRGYGNLFQSTVNDLTSGFTQGIVLGACSFIITGGVWNLYTQRNCNGPAMTVNGETNLKTGRHNFGKLLEEQQIKSIKLVSA